MAATKKGQRPLAERFWEKVAKAGPDECWLWQGATHGSGYGVIRNNHKARPAQQVAWELAHGVPFPDGMLGLHRCDNPPCVNPDHIFPGTYSDNIRDAVAKGRRVDPRLQSHCMHGHPFDAENTYINFHNGRRTRQCRTCNLRRQGERKERRRAARAK